MLPSYANLSSLTTAYDEPVLSMLATLPPPLSNVPWAFVPWGLGLLLRKDLEAASICSFVC